MKKIILRSLAFLLFVSTYLLIFFYPLQRLLSFFDQRANVTLQILAYFLVLFPFFGMLSSKIKRSKFTKLISTISMLYLGISFILFSLLLVFEVINFVFPIDFGILGLLLLVLTILFSLYGIYNANTVHYKFVDLTSKKIKKTYRVVQLTDVHVGSRSPKFLQAVVKKVNLLNPDFVVITGDLIDEKGISNTHLLPLKNLEKKTYFVTGNHENYIDLEEILSNLKKMNITVLRNTYEIFKEIQIIGIDDKDTKTQVKDILPTINVDPKKFSILLYHKPYGFSESIKRGVNLKLSGHTHNGQIIPFNYLVRSQFKEVVGLFKQKNSFMYVSPGTGTWGPSIRIGSQNEITVFELKPFKK